MSRIAGMITGEVKLLSLVQSLSCLLANPAIVVRDWYEPIAREWLEMQARHLQQVRLIVDGTKIGFVHQFFLLLFTQSNQWKYEISVSPFFCFLTNIHSFSGHKYAQELLEKDRESGLSFYTNGPFVDMCAGPHVGHTGELPKDGFKLNSIAGAYWRGDEHNAMLTCIYGLAFHDRESMKARAAQIEEGKRRDHRKLGKELGIFAISDEVGKGLPLWLPNGAILRHELEKLAYETEFKYGYLPVATPHITKEKLYWTSGHLPLYEGVMYPPMRMFEEAEAGGAAAETGEGEPEKYY